MLIARSIDEVFRDAVCRLQDFLSQAKVAFSRSGWHPQGVPNSKRGNVNGAEAQEVRGLHRLLARIAVGSYAIDEIVLLRISAEVYEW